MSTQGWWLTLRPPERVTELVAALQEIGLFPEGDTWWFAWDALDIVLPSLLTPGANVDGDWDVLRVFAERAELRVGRRAGGRGYWLLLEEKPETTLGHLYDTWVESKSTGYSVEEGSHVLAGVRLRLPDGEKRGEIIYPRPLNYGIDDNDLEKALVAGVRAYYDDTYRLITVRYVGIELKQPGSFEPGPFPSPKEAVAMAVREGR